MANLFRCGGVNRLIAFGINATQAGSYRYANPKEWDDSIISVSSTTITFLKPVTAEIYISGYGASWGGAYLINGVATNVDLRTGTSILQSFSVGDTLQVRSNNDASGLASIAFLLAVPN